MKSKHDQAGSLLALAVPPAQRNACRQPCWQPPATRASNLSPATHLPSPALGHHRHPVPAPELLRTSLSDLLPVAEKDLPAGQEAELFWQGKGKLNLPPSLF